MRTLAACSLGGVGHLNPLLPFLAASTERGADSSLGGQRVPVGCSNGRWMA